MTLFGDCGAQQDVETAEYYFRRAIEEGHEEASDFLSEIIVARSTRGLEEYLQTSAASRGTARLRALELLASLGNSKALRELGRLGFRAFRQRYIEYLRESEA